jgi:hypothetical protein
MKTPRVPAGEDIQNITPTFTAFFYAPTSHSSPIRLWPPWVSPGLDFMVFDEINLIVGLMGCRGS